MKYLLFTTVLFCSSFCFALDTATIDMEHDDEVFIINGEKFKAQTYCFGYSEGDAVVFLEGSSYGACATATFKKSGAPACEVWCE